MKKQKYDIAAFVWPAYGNDPRSRTFWSEGMGEWQTVRSAKPKFPGHVEPRKPLWGYCNEANPDVMEMQINAATRHGVNVFIYDWYWYDNRPFLEDCLNDGFLSAPNNELMQFYLMWANHDVNNLWDKRNSHDLNETLIWGGAVNRTTFETICHRVIEKYFFKPNYYKIDNKPVFMIYELKNLIIGLGGILAVKEAFAWFEEQCIKSGLSGVHLQVALIGDSTYKLAEEIGFQSASNYQYVHMTDIDRNYSEIMDDVKKYWEDHSGLELTYIPHISVGWDNNARFYEFKEGIIKGNTPEQVELAFRAAKEFCDNHPENPPLITVNAWNEWIEGSYLQPDKLYGYGYLDAIRKVFINDID